MAPLLGLIVFLGVYPKPVLDRIEPSVDRLVAHVEEQLRLPRARRSRPRAPSVGPADREAAEPARRPKRAATSEPRRPGRPSEGPSAGTPVDRGDR